VEGKFSYKRTLLPKVIYFIFLNLFGACIAIVLSKFFNQFSDQHQQVRKQMENYQQSMYLAHLHSRARYDVLLFTCCIVLFLNFFSAITMLI
jgi:hypothetical protein